MVVVVLVVEVDVEVDVDVEVEVEVEVTVVLVMVLRRGEVDDVVELVCVRTVEVVLAPALVLDEVLEAGVVLEVLVDEVLDVLEAGVVLVVLVDEVLVDEVLVDEVLVVLELVVVVGSGCGRTGPGGGVDTVGRPPRLNKTTRTPLGGTMSWSSLPVSGTAASP